MRYTYRDVDDFQKRNPTRATREDALESMSVREILHIARSCRTAEGRDYFMGFAQQAAWDDLLTSNAAESRMACRKRIA